MFNILLKNVLKHKTIHLTVIIYKDKLKVFI